MSTDDKNKRATPRLADFDVRLVLVFTFALQLYSWWRLDGYQLADSVEYIERAQGFLFGHEVLGPSSVRSFAFSALFLPFYWAAEQLGIEDMRFLVYVFRCGIAFLGLALCLSCMRLGTQLAGRRAGLWTGLLVGANPIFLQYSISPVSGIAAALFISLGLERSLTRGSLKHHVLGGLWLGAGFMMAYQALPIAASIVLAVFARDRFKHLRTSVGTLIGFLGGIGAQVVVDRLSYGEWGTSIFRYIVQNAGGIVVRILGKYLKMGDEALAVYNWIEEFLGRDQVVVKNTAEATYRSLQAPGWYLTSLPTAVVWSVILLFVVGLLRSVKKPRWDVTILLGCLAFNVFLLNQKPSKSFRLWLPLFPFIFPVCALGIELVRGQAEAKWQGQRRLATTALLVATPVLGILALNQLNTRKYGIFWDAADWVNQAIEAEHANDTLVTQQDPPVSPEGFGAGKIRISGSYHWAMFMRESPLSFLVKLPFEIEAWDGLDDAQKQRNIDRLLTLDWYVAHWPSLVNHPDWMAVVSEAFTVEAAFYEYDADPGLAAVLIMKRKPQFTSEVDPNARTFHSFYEDAGDYREALGLTHPVDFVDETSGQRARLLGCDYEVLPGTGLGWVTYHWSSDLNAEQTWTIVDRITTPDEANAWQNDHRLANGLVRFAEIGPGRVLRESHLVVPGVDAYSSERPFQPLGGPYLRGNLLPCELWIKVVRYSEERQVAAQLSARDARSGMTLPTTPGPATPHGWKSSPDGLTRVDSFLMPRILPLVRKFIPAN